MTNSSAETTNPTTTDRQLSRRRFLQGTIALGGATLLPTLPVIAAGSQTERDRILVMIHLNGGNDGLNTVIPFRDPLYRKLRPTIAIPQSQALPITDQLAFHPEMSGLRQLYERGEVGVVNGVGYDQPSLSHFRSTEVWYSAAKEMSTEGWIGRAIDVSGTCDGICGVGLRESPFALTGAGGPAPDVREPADFVIPSSLAGIEDRYLEWSERAGVFGDVGRLGVAAVKSSRKLSSVRPARLPRGTGLARDLRLAIGLLEADLGIRFLHLSMPGFDSHDSQANRHANLLGQLSNGIAGFQAELENRGLAERVVTVLFSEFGRRPAENSGGGTDHGTAGPMFVIGRSVTGGSIGKQPVLDQLSDRNLRHQIDFRRVYAGLLADWSGIEPEPVLGKHEPLSLFKDL